MIQILKSSLEYLESVEVELFSSSFYSQPSKIESMEEEQLRTRFRLWFLKLWVKWEVVSLPSKLSCPIFFLES